MRQAFLVLRCAQRHLIEQVLIGAPPQMRLAGFPDGECDAILEEICSRNAEGVAAKSALSCYTPDKPSGAWVKVKGVFVEEFVSNLVSKHPLPRLPFIGRSLWKAPTSSFLRYFRKEYSLETAVIRRPPCSYGGGEADDGSH